MNTLTQRETAPTLRPVFAGEVCIGTMISRGCAGTEAFDRDTRSLGIYPTLAAATEAIRAVQR